MRVLFFMLLLLGIGCKKENNRSTTPVEPGPLTYLPDTAYYSGLLTSIIIADCLNGGGKNFDSAYPATMMVEYPDSGSVRFHFSFADYKISYATCKYEQYEAVRVAKFEQKQDSAYATGATKTPPGATKYMLRGDSLFITESAQESKWYSRYTTFIGKKR